MTRKKIPCGVRLRPHSHHRSEGPDGGFLRQYPRRSRSGTENGYGPAAEIRHPGRGSTSICRTRPSGPSCGKNWKRTRKKPIFPMIWLPSAPMRPSIFLPKNAITQPYNRLELFKLFTRLEFVRLIDRYGLRGAELEEAASESAEESPRGDPAPGRYPAGAGDGGSRVSGSGRDAGHCLCGGVCT